MDCHKMVTEGGELCKLFRYRLTDLSSKYATNFPLDKTINIPPAEFQSQAHSTN